MPCPRAEITPFIISQPIAGNGIGEEGSGIGKCEASVVVPEIALALQTTDLGSGSRLRGISTQGFWIQTSQDLVNTHVSHPVDDTWRDTLTKAKLSFWKWFKTVGKAAKC